MASAGLAADPAAGGGDGGAVGGGRAGRLASAAPELARPLWFRGPRGCVHCHSGGTQFPGQRAAQRPDARLWRADDGYRGGRHADRICAEFRHGLRDLQHVRLAVGPVPFCRRGHHLPAQDPSEAFRHVADGCLCGRHGGDGAGHLGRLCGSDAGLLHRRSGRDSAAQPGGEHGRGTLPPDGRPSLADEPPCRVAIPLLVCAGLGSAGSRSDRVHGDCREGLSPAVGHAVHAGLRAWSICAWRCWPRRAKAVPREFRWRRWRKPGGRTSSWRASGSRRRWGGLLRYGLAVGGGGGGDRVAAGADGVGRPRIAHLHHVLPGGDGGGVAGRLRAGVAGHRIGGR